MVWFRELPLGSHSLSQPESGDHKLPESYQKEHAISASKKQLRILSKDEPLIRTVSTGHLLKDIINEKLIEHNQKL